MTKAYEDGIPHEANSYYDSRFIRQAVKILPGEYFATSKDTLMVTVLGSCVSACLLDVKNGVAGMNHFLLPTDRGMGENQYGSAARYGMYAMELLIDEMMKLGADKRQLQAKVFGGGNVLSSLTLTNIGEMNAEFVEAYLRRESIPIIASDLLDNFARKIYFFPDTGQVLVKKIRNFNNSTIMDRESMYRMKLRERDNEDDIDLFEGDE